MGERGSCVQEYSSLVISWIPVVLVFLPLLHLRTIPDPDIVRLIQEGYLDHVHRGQGGGWSNPING